MNLVKKIENMSNDQVKAIWDSFNTQSWDSKTMHNEETSMDEWGMLIYSEMDLRGLKK